MSAENHLEATVLQSCTRTLGVGGAFEKWKGRVMISTDHIVIGSCDELSPGDAIEAFYKNTLVHRGPVTEVAPDLGLFWILDTLTGSRRVLDISELSILRLPAHYREVQVGAPSQ
jgi:hypothetical protein